MSQTSSTPSTKIDFIYLSEPDMVRAGVTDMPACVDTMEDMFGLLHQGDYRMAGSNNNSHGSLVLFPEDSPFPNMPKPTPDRRFMAMPAYLGGQYCTAGVKWYGSNIENRDRGLPRSILMFVLSDADTGAPLAFMSANLLSAYRTRSVDQRPLCTGRSDSGARSGGKKFRDRLGFVDGHGECPGQQGNDVCRYRACILRPA